MHIDNYLSMCEDLKVLSIEYNVYHELDLHTTIGNDMDLSVEHISSYPSMCVDQKVR